MTTTSFRVCFKAWVNMVYVKKSFVGMFKTTRLATQPPLKHYPSPKGVLASLAFVSKPSTFCLAFVETLTVEGKDLLANITPPLVFFV